MERGTRATNHSLSSALNLGWRARPGCQVCLRPLCPHLPAQARRTPPPPLGRLCPAQLVPFLSWFPYLGMKQDPSSDPRPPPPPSPGDSQAMLLFQPHFQLCTET